MAYLTITNAEIEPDKPLTSNLVTRLRDNTDAVANGRFVRMRVYTSSGTWTFPASEDGQMLKRVKVTVVGGGRIGSSGSSEAAGPGGAGGGTAIKVIEEPLLGVLDNTEAVTVGAAGGTSSFGAHCSATGGTTSGGGEGSGGDLNIKGEPGGVISGYVGGRGGSSMMGGGGAGGAVSLGSAGGDYGGGGGGGAATPGASGGAGAPGVVIVEEYF
jgi:hypothetical protein